MSPEMLRHYGKRARALMIAQNAADRVTGGKIAVLSGAKELKATGKNG